MNTGKPKEGDFTKKAFQIGGSEPTITASTSQSQSLPVEEGEVLELADFKDLANDYYKKLTERKPIKGIGSQEHIYFIYGIEWAFNRLKKFAKVNQPQEKQQVLAGEGEWIIKR